MAASLDQTQAEFTRIPAVSAVDPPIVSAVIPTFHRPDLVDRAVGSALNQTCRPVEVIVVVDGRDEATLARLKAIRDPAVKAVLPDRHLGNAAARNLGVRQASGDWIAFLDDDDEWMPRKLELQLEAAAGSRHRSPIVGCRVIARTGTVDLIWPRRTPRPGERLCDYMCRRSLPLAGEGLLQSSMILTPRELLLRVPFAESLRRHVDSDWVLRAACEPDVGVVFPASSDPLAVWHIESHRRRVSATSDWRYSLGWCRSRRELFTREAYAGFLCKNVSAQAAAAGDWRAFDAILREARRVGRPSWVDVTSHLLNWTLRPSMRDRIWALYRRGRAR